MRRCQWVFPFYLVDLVICYAIWFDRAAYWQNYYSIHGVLKRTSIFLLRAFDFQGTNRMTVRTRFVAQIYLFIMGSRWNVLHIRTRHGEGRLFYSCLRQRSGCLTVMCGMKDSEGISHLACKLFRVSISYKPARSSFAGSGLSNPGDPSLFSDL